MFALIRKYEQSGLSQEQFFNQFGIPRSTFGYWRKKYLRETGRSRGKNSFIPVKLDHPPVKDHQVIELAFPNSMRMVCPADTEPSLLKSLIVLQAHVYPLAKALPL